MVCINIFWVNGPISHRKLKLMLDDNTSVFHFKKRVLHAIMEKVKLSTDRVLDKNIDTEIAIIIGDGSHLTKKENYLILADLCLQDSWHVIASTRHYGLTLISFVHEVFDNPKAKPKPTVLAKFHLAQETIGTLKKYIVEFGKIRPSQSQYLTLTYDDSPDAELQDSNFPLSSTLDQHHNTIRYYIKNPKVGWINITIAAQDGVLLNLRVPPYLTVGGVKRIVRSRKGIPIGPQRFVFNNQPLRNGKLSDFGVNDGSCLELYSEQIGGGCNDTFAGRVDLPDISFADVSDSRNKVERRFAKRAPRWRIAYHGLNIEGICGNSRCKAYEQQVVAPWNSPSFHLRNDSSKVHCPICKVTLKSLLTCGFTSTFWKYFGRRSNSDFELVSGDWQEAKKTYTTFDVNGSGGGLQGMENWNLLVIQTRPRIVDRRGSYSCPTHCGSCFKPFNFEPGYKDESDAFHRLSCDHVFHQKCTKSADFHCTMCPKA